MENVIYMVQVLLLLYLQDILHILQSLKGINNCETIKAVTFSDCKPTTKYQKYSNLGILDPDELADKRHTAYIIFEGEFSGMSPEKKFVPELAMYIPVHTVEATLIVVHTDNYGLPTRSGNYTNIVVKSKKGEQNNDSQVTTKITYH